MYKAVIKLVRISKKYILYHQRPTLAENILFRRTREEFWALKNINLTINKGERVGIIGPNGSGKTTLLEIIAGITTPNIGTVTTHGKIVSLIALEAGFQPDLTGEENIYLNALLIGMSKREVESKFKEIVAFANIGKFIDAPMYTHSQGMKLRLGFSVAVHSSPSILVFDENLSIGDQNFRKKSFDRIEEFFEQGKTVIMVSHDLDFLKANSDRVIWLDGGKVVNDGATQKIIRLYKKFGG